MAFILRPLVTEKMTKITDKRPNRYGFVVRPDANKLQIKEEVERGFGSIEDEMILSVIEETGQRDEFILKYKRRFPEQLDQDTERVRRAKAIVAERTRSLHSFDDIIRIRPTKTEEHVIEIWDDDYDPFNVAFKDSFEQSDCEIG